MATRKQTMPPSPRKFWPLRRKRVFALSLGFGLLLVGLLALGEWAGWPFLRTPLAQQLSRLSGLPVSLQGRFRMHLLLLPGMEVERLSVSSTPSLKLPYLMQAQGLALRWRWADLWRSWQGGPLRLQRLQAEQLDAYLLRLADGELSWAPAKPPGAAARPQAAALPQIDTLLLRKGHIDYRDELLAIALQIQITQSQGALPWHATASGNYRGAKVALQAQAGADLPLLMLAGEGKDPAMKPLRLSGQIGHTQLAFDGATGALWAGQGLRGQLRVRGASLRSSGAPLGLTLPDTPPFRLSGRIERAGAVWSLVTDDATVGSSALTADLHFDTATQPPTLRGQVGGRRLALADLAPAIGADQAPRQAGRVLPDEVFDLPSLAAMNADVRVALAMLDLGSPKIKPVRDLKAQLTLANSRLTLAELSAGVAGGQLTGSISLQAEQPEAQWSAALRLAEVDLQAWLPALTPKPAPTPTPEAQRPAAPAYLSGLLDAKLSLHGHGRSVAEVLGSGNGRLSLELRQGEMSQLLTEAIGLDVAQALGLLVAGDQGLRLSCARAEAVIQDGLLKTHHATLDNADSTLYIQGGASLKTETLQLRLIAEPKDFSPLSLRTPLQLTGTFKQPQVQLEARGLLARVAGAVVLGALAPPAALLAFIDTGAAPDRPPCAPSPPKKVKRP